MKARVAAIVLAGCALLGGEPAWAQAAASAQPVSIGTGDVTVYPAAYFDQFLPNNAQEMIQKLPGFTFSQGDNVRGFAGAAGNVLIDGVRPSSKSVGLDQLLQRIAAKSVLRIELIRGGAPGIDMQGLPVIANVVRVPGGEAATTLQALFKFYPDGRVAGVGRIEQSWRRGPLSIEGQLQVRSEMNNDNGDGGLVRLGPAVNESGRFKSDVWSKFYTANTTIEYRLPNNDLAHLTLGAERYDLRRGEIGYPVIASTGQSFFERTQIKQRNDKGEISGDYTHAFSPVLSGQLIALKTLKRDIQRSAIDGRNTAQAAFEKGDTSEAIGRAVLTATFSPKLRFEVGGEGALNSLDATSFLRVGGASVAVPSANVRVEETRGEAFATLNLRPANHWAVELGARYEASKIAQTGGANQSRNLSFFKPRLILSYDPSGSSQVRLRVQRNVGQLNFKDFAASSSLDAGTVNAGNPNLVPERAWIFEAAVEKRFWGAGSLILTAQHQDVQDVADLIPVRGFDAPGNIGGGTRQELKASLTLPLEKLGVRGGTLRLNTAWRWSRVVDPVTGISRRISGQRPFEGDFYIGKQLPKLKSTISMDGFLGYTETFYRIGEIRRNLEQPLLKIYWDWAPLPGFTVRVQAENFTAKDRKRNRTLFNGPRSANLATLREERYAEMPAFVMIRLRQAF